MPTPHGRDRVAELEDGSLALSSLRPKGWTARVETGGVVASYGTAVEWEGAIWEVLRVEATPSGGTRYVLGPWDGRLLIRSFVRYPGDDESPLDRPPPGVESLQVAGLAAAGRTSEAARPVASTAATGTATVTVTKAWRTIPSRLRSLVLGFVPGVLLGWLFPFHLMGEGMSFLVHELGHTAVSLLFGSLAVPAVILTITFQQSRLAAAMIWAVLIWFTWRACAARWPRGLLALLVSSAVLYPFVAFTPLTLDAIQIGGHLAEVVIAALFFHRAIGSPAFAEWERPVYAFFAWYLWVRNVRLFLGVATDSAARTDYLSIAITGENDLVKVANAHGLDLATVAFAAFVVAAAVPAAGLVHGLRNARREAAG